MTDLQGRNIDYLRVAITDKCNLRCVYCMPRQGVEFIPHADLLTFEEILRVVACAARLGIRAVRVTGGEPMARRGCLDLIGLLKHTEGISRVAMTTNGILLRGRMAQAAAAGLDALNVSIDTTDPGLYARMTRGGDVRETLAAIREAVDCGLSVRLNAVPVRGFNDRSLADLAALAAELPVDVRFIELMPVGCGSAYSRIPIDEVRRQLEDAFGVLLPDPSPHGMGPAEYFRPEGFTGSIGLIGAVSHAFCGSCNRIRLTPEGQLKPCLNHLAGADLRSLMRGGCSDSRLTETIRDTILHKPLNHGFDTHSPDSESRGMNRIGG